MFDFSQSASFLLNTAEVSAGKTFSLDSKFIDLIVRWYLYMNSSFKGQSRAPDSRDTCRLLRESYLCPLYQDASEALFKMFHYSDFQILQVWKLLLTEKSASVWSSDWKRKSINIFVNFLFTSTFLLHFGVSLLSITFKLVHLMNFYGGSFKIFFFSLTEWVWLYINSVFTQIKYMLWLSLYQLIYFPQEKSIFWILIFNLHKKNIHLEDWRMNFQMFGSVSVTLWTDTFTSFSMADCSVHLSPQDGAVKGRNGKRQAFFSPENTSGIHKQ